MRRAALALAAFALLGSSLVVAAQPGAAVMVVVSSRSSVQALSAQDLRRLFGERRLTAPDGRRLVAVNLDARHPARQLFDRAVLGLEADQVGRYWVNRRIRGRSGPPRALPNEAMALRFVENLPDVVGYVTNGPLPAGLRIVPIDGLVPGEPGYLLEVRE